MTALRRWFQQKFNLPVSSKEWLESDPFDLMLHFLEDHYEEDEEAARKARLRYLGYEMSPSGDPLVDLWERQVAKGEMPDLDLEEPENAKIRDAKIRAAAQRQFELTGQRIYIAPRPSKSDLLHSHQEWMQPDMEQIGDLMHLAAAGDHDALMMLAEFHDNKTLGQGQQKNNRMQLVPVDQHHSQSTKLPDAIDFENLDEVDWSSMSSVDIFRAAGQAARPSGQKSKRPRETDDFVDPFDEAAAWGFFDTED